MEYDRASNKRNVYKGGTLAATKTARRSAKKAVPAKSAPARKAAPAKKSAPAAEAPKKRGRPAARTEDGQKDYTVLLDREATTVQDQFADWIIEKTGLEFSTAKEEKAFRTGVRLGKVTIMDFQKETADERRAERAAAKTEAPPKKRGKKAAAPAVEESEEEEYEEEEEEEPEESEEEEAEEEEAEYEEEEEEAEEEEAEEEEAPASPARRTRRATKRTRAAAGSAPF